MLLWVRHLTALIHQLRSRGLRHTVASVVEYAEHQRREWVDASFDRKYGTDTGGIIDDMSELGVITAAQGEHAFGYQGIQVAVFRSILADLGVEPEGYSFIDFGSGKGRAVMMAAERRFAAVYGVEFSPVLHALAERNVARFREKNQAASRIELTCQDAAEFVIPAGDLVCFFYNPFDDAVMRRVLANIAAACERTPRRVVVAYRNPACAGVFDEFPFLRLVSRNSTYCTYRSPSP